MSYFGREFVLQSQERYDEILEFVFPDLPEIAKEALSNFKATIKIVKNENKYTITTTELNDKVKETTFKNGDTLEESTVKVKCTVEEDTYTRVLEIPDALITFILEFSDDQLVETITHNKWDGECKRFYEAAK